MTNPNSDSLRVFISYSHEDKPRVRKICGVLEDLGYQPMWDEHIRAGAPFTDEIKRMIMRSHAFLPLLTKQSRKKPWVHQETGFAIALNIPVVPLAIEGEVPREMIAEYQAIQVKPSLADLKSGLSKAKIASLVERNPTRSLCIIEIADLRQMRASLLSDCARQVLDGGSMGMVRQKGMLSSYSIPRQPVGNRIWNRMYSHLDEYTKRLYRREREALETHSLVSGARLIIDPAFTPPGMTQDAKRARLEILLQYLESDSGRKTEVAISPRASGSNLVIVGNWFMAESMAPRPAEGYRHTVFNWHAPTVQKAVKEFDENFADLMSLTRRTTGHPREFAVQRIHDLLRKPSLSRPRQSSHSSGH